ncbi:MAG TPA: glycogen debranching N-terminal domain-containing protein [Dehalococcoidia bacterium]|nr:glycogen debranching N-terminal domain-containing protein [Dehalococcoidia bacterium]
MPVEISVGPAVLTINQGSTFMVTDLNGQIAADGEQGIFASDTRFVSYYDISANGTRWERLTSSALTYYASRVFLTNAAFETEDGPVAEGVLSLVLGRSIAEGIHEDIDIHNYGLSRVRFNLEVVVRSDFADIFEVKSKHFVRRGRIVTDWDAHQLAMRTSYSNRDFERTLVYRLLNNTSLPTYANGRLTFEVALDPGAAWHTCCFYTLIDGHHAKEPLRVSHDGDEVELDRLERDWRQCTTQLSSSNEDVYRLYRRSIDDMSALRLHEHDFAERVWLPAAGVPWFVTIFGRDSLIVSLQSMLVEPTLALGTLKQLALMQARASDDWRDADPGKMPHEMRFGELAHFKKIPHTPYYGTADATILYVILLHEAWMWLGDDALLAEHLQTAERCLEWIDRYGDLDGDGFQEYKTRSDQGYENMGWKDSGDAIVYPDGSQVHQPKALCELQGYVFDAWMRMAEIFEHTGDIARAGELRRKAADLRARFEARFWCEDVGFYALALDPDKRAVKTIASNAGHCLWSGIASPEHAARVVRRLFEPDMWSGWGIRTLSSRHPAYNPFSYQLGSVWPHDNGLIAMGFARYGFREEAARVARDISGAASYFEGYRLPELYAGIERTPGSFPVQYRGANVPQAWAAASIFHLLRAMLGMHADAPHGRLNVDPALPPWLPDVTLRGIDVGKATLDLRFWREGERSRWEVLQCDGDIAVSEAAWRPWPDGDPNVRSNIGGA